MLIGENIKSRRLELGLSLNDIAKSIGVSKSTVFDWEAGNIKEITGFNKISLLAKALDVKPSFFIKDWSPPLVKEFLHITPELGERIKNKREELSLTQKQLAEKVKVTEETIANWEKGSDYRLKQKEWVPLSHALEVDFSFFRPLNLVDDDDSNFDMDENYLREPQKTNPFAEQINSLNERGKRELHRYLTMLSSHPKYRKK